MTKVILVHGFNVRDGGKGTVDKLAPYLIKAGYYCDIDEADYGFLGLLAVRLRKFSAVRRIATALDTADVVITHSNGANFANKALKLREFHDQRYKVVSLSPALNSKARVPKNVEKGFVYYTRNDFWVWVSGFIPFHPWGRQGWHGYRGDDPRVVNRDCSDLIKSHSDWFADENIEFIADEIILSLEAS